MNYLDYTVNCKNIHTIVEEYWCCGKLKVDMMALVVYV